MLQSKADLIFHEEPHRYQFKETWIPFSVTGICSHDLCPKVKERIFSTISEWQPRGHAVHAALEAFLKREEADVDPKWMPWVEPLLDHPCWSKYDAVGVELRMVSRDLYYAGSLDALLTDGDKVVLVDLKTKSSKKSRMSDHRRQMGAYVHMLEVNFGVFVDKCVILAAKPGAVDQAIYDPSDCYEQWHACLEEFKSKQPDF